MTKSALEIAWAYEEYEMSCWNAFKNRNDKSKANILRVFAPEFNWLPS